MRRIPCTDTVLRLVDSPVHGRWACRSCQRLQIAAARQFHTTPIARADEPWYRRMRDTFFGNKDDEGSAESRDETVSKRTRVSDPYGPLETKQDELGNVYEVARNVDKTTHADYTPSATWHGLERIGGEDWVRQQRDSGKKYHSFNRSKETNLSDEEWTDLVHHVAVEALTQRQAGFNILRICTPTRPAIMPTNKEHTMAAAIDPTTGKLSWTSTKSMHATLKAVNPKGQMFKDPQIRYIDGKSLKVKPQPKSDESMSFAFDESNLKFVIVKRIYQLTGHRLSDAKLNDAKNLKSLAAAYSIRPVQKKLAATDQVKILNETLGNVKVYNKRQTPVHKDREVGRWKIIEEELSNRGLPAYGSNWIGAKIPLPPLHYGDKKQKWQQNTKAYQIPKNGEDAIANLEVPR